MANHNQPKFPPNQARPPNVVKTAELTHTDGTKGKVDQVHGPAAESLPQAATPIIPGSPLEAQLNYLKSRGWKIVSDDGFGHFLLEDPRDAVLRDPKFFNPQTGLNEYPVMDTRKNPPVQVLDVDGQPKKFCTPTEWREAVELPSAEGGFVKVKQWHGPPSAWDRNLINALMVQRQRDQAGETPHETIARKERELREMKDALAKEEAKAAQAKAS
jgi:hypothetical protein